MNEQPMNPPAQIQLEFEETTRLTQLKEACGRIERSHRSTMQARIEAGGILVYFKSRMKPGQFDVWLMGNFPFSRASAYRWIHTYIAASGQRISEMGLEQLNDIEDEARAAGDALDQCHENEANRCLNETKSQTEPTNEVTNSTHSTKRCRYCRTHPPLRDCKECAKMNLAVSTPSPINNGKHPESGKNTAKTQVDRQREPGEDPIEPMDKLAKIAELAKKLWIKRTEISSSLKVVSKSDKDRCQQLLREGFDLAKKFAEAAYRPIPPPEDTVCPKCKSGVMLVTNGETGKKTYIDYAQGHYPWRREGGLILRLHKSIRNGTEHQRHAATCPAIERGKRG